MVGVEQRVAGPAARLGLVHGGVGVAEQLLRTVPQGDTGGDADAGGDEDRLPGQLERCLEPVSIRLATATASCAPPMSGSSTVNSSPPRRASVSPSRRQPASRCATSRRSWSPASVAEAVVDHLEVVQVDEEQADGLPRCRSACSSRSWTAPVRQAGQRVVERLLGQPLLVQRPLGDVTVVEHQTADGGVVKQVGGGHLETPGRPSGSA
jgi:hypothetical protein